MRQDNRIYNFVYRTIFLKYRTKQIKAIETNNKIETNKVKKEHFNETRQYNINLFSIELSLSSKGQNKSKLQRQISKILI